MASHGLKRKAEVLSALVDKIYGEIGTTSTTSKRFRIDSAAPPKSKNDLLKEFSVQHLESDAKKSAEAQDSPLPIPEVVDETPIVLDREAFLKRLQTYSALFTYGKPITPVECASHGWIDTRDHGLDLEVSKLRCEICAGVVYVTDVKHGVSEELLHSIREKYLKGLSELHEKNCIWKYSECDDWIYSFPFFTSYDAIKKWQDQVYTLVTKNESLPPVTSPLTTENLAMMKKLLKLELELSNGDQSPDWLQHKNLDSALVLPLFGWTFFEIEGRSALKCELCFRALGLWGYNCDGVPLSKGCTSPNRLDSIDAEKEHRHYCPYINRKQAQITTVSTSRHSTQDSGQAICGWEFMLDMATIESKHLEEMYDLSPKAEQQRSRLRQEAQDLMKAAKSRLSQVLSGGWMRQSISTPEVEATNDHIDVVKSPISTTPVTPLKEGELSPPSIVITQNETEPSTPVANLADGAICDEESINMEDAFGEVTPKAVDVLDHVSEQPIEIPKEEMTRVEAPLEVINMADDLIRHKPQVIATGNNVTGIDSPGSSLDVNLSTASTPISKSAVQEAKDGRQEDEEKTMESELHQNGGGNETDYVEAISPSSNMDETVDASLPESVEATSEIVSAIETPLETTEAEETFDSKNVEEREDEAMNTSTNIEEEATGDEEVPIDTVEGTLCIQDSAIEDIVTNLNEKEEPFEGNAEDVNQLDQTTAQEVLQKYDEQGLGEQEQIEQDNEAAEVEESLDTEEGEIEVEQTKEEHVQDTIEADLTVENPNAEIAPAVVEEIDNYNFEEVNEEGLAGISSREVIELRDDDVIDEQPDIVEKNEEEEADRIMDEVVKFDSANADHQDYQTHQDGEMDLPEQTDVEVEPYLPIEQADSIMHEDTDDDGEREREREVITLAKVASPISPFPYEEEEDDDDQDVLPHDGMNEENDLVDDTPPAIISDIEQDTGDENAQTENNVEDTLVEGGTPSDQLERDFEAYIEEPQASEEQTVDAIEPDVADKLTHDELQIPPVVEVQDDDGNDYIPVNSEHVPEETIAHTNMPDGQESTEAQLDLEGVPAVDEPANEINDEEEAGILSPSGLEAIADEATADESPNVKEDDQQHEATADESPNVTDDEQHHEATADKSPNVTEDEQQHEVYEVNVEHVLDSGQQEQHEEVQDDATYAVEDATSPPMPTPREDDLNDSTDGTKTLEVSTDEAALSEQASLQEIGELNAEIAAAEKDMSLQSGEEPLAEIGGTSQNLDTSLQEPFIVIEGGEVQQPTEEEYEMISTDDLPVLHAEESIDSQHPEEAKVSIEVEGNAIVEVPSSPTIAVAQQKTGSSLTEPTDNAVDINEEKQPHQHMLDNEQLEEYVDNEQLGEFLEEQPVYTPEPESTELSIIPASHIQAVDQVSTPQLIDEIDGDELQEDENVMDAFTTADEYEEHVMLDLEQPIAGAEDLDQSAPESSSGGAITEDVNTIESEIHDSTMETDEDYTKESDMLDME